MAHAEAPRIADGGLLIDLDFAAAHQRRRKESRRWRARLDSHRAVLDAFVEATD